MDFHGVSPFHVDWSFEVKGMERVPKRGVNLTKITYLKKKFFQKIYVN
jgi:hypothetical protein